MSDRREWPLWEVFVRSRRGLSHVHVGSLHAPDAEMALRNARDVYTRRQEGVSLWVVPGRRRSPRRARRRRTRSSTRPATRSTGTRPSTTSPKGSSTCDDHHRRRSRSAARRPSYALALGDDALIAAQRMGEWIAAAPQLEEDVALGNIGARPARPGAHAAHLRRLADGPAAHRGRARLPARRARRSATCSSSSAPGARGPRLRASRWPGCWCCRRYLHELYAALSRSTDPTLAGGGREGGQGGRLPPRPRADVGAAARRRHRGVARADAWPRWRASGRYVDELFDTAHIAPELVDDRGRGRPAVVPATPSTGRVTAILHEATLEVPEVTSAVTGGRRGVHTKQMGFLLAEMQHLARSHPGATW